MPRAIHLLAGVLLVVAACGSGGSDGSDESVPPPEAAEPTGPFVPVRVNGSLERVESRWVLCPGSVAPCWPVVDDGGLELIDGRVVAEGDWQADTLRLRTLEHVAPTGWDPPDPCAAEGREVGTFDPDRVGADAALDAFLDGLADLAATWLSADRSTLVVVVTGDAHAPQAAAAAQGLEGVCVADLGFEHTSSVLEAIQEEVADHLAVWGDEGWIATSLGIDTLGNVVVASFDQVDRRLRVEIESRWGDTVAIDATVEVLEGTVGDLEREPSEREIPITTQPRGAAGMDALGRFTLRYDAAADCLWFEGGDGDRVKPIWPAGTRALRDPVVVLDARGDPWVAVGQQLETAGGFGQLLPDSDDPTDCGANEAWVIAPGG